MLHIYIGNLYNEKNKQRILKGRSWAWSPDDYFDSKFDFKLLKTPRALEIIKETSGGVTAELVRDTVILFNRFNEAILPKELPSGTKGLLLAEFDDNYVLELQAIGDNCDSLLIDIANRKDITVTTTKLLNPYTQKYYGYKDIVPKDKIHILNDDSYVDNGTDFLLKSMDLLRNNVLRKDLIIKDGKLTKISLEEAELLDEMERKLKEKNGERVLSSEEVKAIFDEFERKNGKN